MELETKRLVIREYKKSDSGQIVKNINNLKIAKPLVAVPFPYSLRDAAAWIKQCLKNAKKKPREKYGLAIILKSEKNLIGGIALSHIDYYQKTAVLGYWLGERYWGKHYATEAINAVLKFAFKKLKLRRIESTVLERNIPSQRLLEKTGFKREGLRRKARKIKATSKISNEYIYGLLKEDFKMK